MKIRSLLALCAAVALTGCVSNKKYAALQAEHQALQQDYTTMQVNLAESRTNGKNLEAMLEDARRHNEQLKANYANLQKTLDNSIQQNTQGNVNISKLVDQINASNKYIKQLVEAKSKSDSSIWPLRPT